MNRPMSSRPLPPGPYVSLYANAHEACQGFSVPLLTVLRGIRRGRWREQIERVRACADKKSRSEAKEWVPAFTASGLFPLHRSLNGLAQPSDVMAIDFDAGDNPDVLDKRAALQLDAFTWVCSLSASATGLFVLVRLRPGADHSAAFDGLKGYYERVHGLRADRACRDICRLRFVSYDPQLFFNGMALQFVPAPVLPPPPRPKLVSPHDASGLDSGYDFNATVDMVEAMRIDLTSTYRNWVRLGFALAMNLGEDGRDYFHRLSCFHPQYDQLRCESKFDSCLREQGQRKASLGTFYYLVKEAGLEPVPRSKQLQYS